MNKKYIYGGIAVLGIMVTAGWNVNLNSQSNKLSGAMLANVEALAEEGSGYSCSASANCYYGSQQECSVSCTGTGTCYSYYEKVVCDGHESRCL